MVVYGGMAYVRIRLVLVGFLKEVKYSPSRYNFNPRITTPPLKWPLLLPHLE